MADDMGTEELDREAPPNEAGFIKFYALYWAKKHVDWSNERLLGQPKGWMGKGKISKDFDRATVQMNFWAQKGVYVLYDDRMLPVYAGQAGLVRKKAGDGQTIGDRLLAHNRGVYRNGWTLFSWFGFLDTDRINLKSAGVAKLLSPNWKFEGKAGSDLNDLLASFEAILIEGFAPRFNARGGDLGRAVLVDQFDKN